MSARLQLTKTERAQIEAMREVLAPWGLTSIAEAKTTHRHLTVVAPNGVRHRLTVACTPRNDDMALHIARQKAQRLVREITEGICS